MLKHSPWLLSTLFALSGFVPFNQGNLTPDLVRQERSAALVLTNKLRAAHHAAPLVIDNRLNQIAQEYAEHLANTGNFQHSENGYGENLYSDSGYAHQGVATRAVQAWYDEVADYRFDAPGFSSATGHFTQVVWKGSRKVGFGIALSANKRSLYVVANYDPPGNVLKAFKSNVSPK